MRGSGQNEGLNVRRLPRPAGAALSILCLVGAAMASSGDDCNGNGVPDDQDIADGVSIDCDGNGIPDECQPCDDCDGNGLLDHCELTAGPGLVGEYWISTNGAGSFDERVGVRVDPVVDFDWGGGGPDLPGVPPDNFLVRWTGTLTTPDSIGPYTFYTRTDDGVRLWVDGLLLIDEWAPQSETEWSGSIVLMANTSYEIRMEYFESGGSASAQLLWKPWGGEKAVIPADALEPMADVNGDGVPDSCEGIDCNGNGVPDVLDVQSGASEDCNANCIPDECDLVPTGVGYWRFEEIRDPVADWGSSGVLEGTTTNGVRSNDVAVDPVPLNGLSNHQSMALGGNGYVVIGERGGLLSMSNEPFTLEAWVRMDELSSGAPGSRQWLCQKKRANSADTQLNYAVLVQAAGYEADVQYGKESGLTGRELMFLFGAGEGTVGVTSMLEIEETGWRFVSVAFDPAARIVRFGLDGEYEAISIDGHTMNTNTGPLVIGAHTSSLGEPNQYLRGAVDEFRLSAGFLSPARLLDFELGADCNQNHVPDECDIADGAASDCNGNLVPDECETDCNGNGVADECDVADGVSADCNGDLVPDECQLGVNDCNGNGIPDDCDLNDNDCNSNGVPDECDVAAGFSEDCNGNGTPDECEVTTGAYDYLLEDGFAEYGVRADELPHMAWINQFTVENDATTIWGLDLAYVYIPSGSPVTVCVWSDPNGDGEPSDAELLTSASATVGVADGLTLNRVLIDETPIGPDGTSFFVGVMISNVTTADFPAPLDASIPSRYGRSWLIGSSTAIDPNDLSNVTGEYDVIENILPFPGNWVIRALAATEPSSDCNGNGVPDACDVLNGTSLDIDGNLTPDECEDCNGNGIPDGCDVSCPGDCASVYPDECGLASDCNGDGVPDACQLFANDCNGDGAPDDCQLADNDCNGNGSPDDCDIASAESADLNGNGVPDECEDCNGNGVFDSVDIADGLSADCQGDGIPDECQYGEPGLLAYRLDDGTAESTLGIGAPSTVAWLNRMQVEAGGEVIRSIEVMHAGVPAGASATVLLWSDPNGDGDPTDALVLASAEMVVIQPGNGEFQSVRIPDTHIGETGTSFFVGVMLDDELGSMSPIVRDTTEPLGQSWLVYDANVGSLDPNDLGSSDLLARLDAVGFPSNCMIRASAYDGELPNDCNGNGIPDECDIADGLSVDSNGNGTPDECECLGDLDSNGEVDETDLLALLDAWGPCAGCDSDLTDDGRVDSNDLFRLLGSWGDC